MFDFSGAVLARWSSEQVRALSFTGRDGEVLVVEEDGGLWRWNWRRDERSRVATNARAACAVGDDVYFMPNSAELWRVEPARDPKLVLRALGHDGSSGWLQDLGVSPDGGAIRVSLTVVAKGDAGEVRSHGVALVEVASKRVQVIDAVFSYSWCWF